MNVTVIATDPGGSSDLLTYIISGTDAGPADIGNSGSANLTFNSAGEKVISVRVRDDEGSEVSVQVPVTVNHAPPIVTSVSSDGPVNEGSPVTIDVVARDSDSASGALSYEYDFSGAADGSSDGIFETTSNVHTYLDEGTYAVNVRITDDDGASTIRTVNVVVNNVEPVISVAGSAFADEGEVYSLLLRADDPGNDPVLLWRVDWGDGSIEDFPGDVSSATHRYADDTAGLSIPIQVTAIQEDGSFTINQTRELEVQYFQFANGPSANGNFYHIASNDSGAVAINNSDEEQFLSETFFNVPGAAGCTGYRIGQSR